MSAYTTRVATAEIESGAPDVKDDMPPMTITQCIEGIKNKDAASWGYSLLRTVLLVFFLYFFLFFLDLMGGSFKVLGGCTAGAMFDGLSNPIAGLMVGILATVLVQSSSTSTSIVVSLVGADAMTVPVAIPVIMGANIGTSVTNTLVSFGQVNDDDEFERAFAGATVHDMFNFLSVAVLLPIELIFHPLLHMTEAMKPEDVDDGEKWEGPIKQWVAPLVKRVLNANKDIIKDVAKGTTTCSKIYAEIAENAATAEHGDSKGLIKCGDVLNPFTMTESKICPAFYTENASKSDDMAAGGVCLFISIIGLCVCLFCLVKVLQSIVMSSSTALIKRATNINPYFAMIIGVGVTLLVQSSSITTSVLTPLVGLDIVTLEQMFPLTLGANIGTTGTALLASMVSTKPESVQIALCHLFFNIFGILIWFPIPAMRNVPIAAARKLGELTRQYKGFPVIYILFAFVMVPAVLLGVSTMYDKGGPYVVIGVFLTIALVVLFLRVLYWFKKEDGMQKVTTRLAEHQEKVQFRKDLKTTIESIEERLALLESGGKAEKTVATVGTRV